MVPPSAPLPASDAAAEQQLPAKVLVLAVLVGFYCEQWRYPLLALLGLVFVAFVLVSRLSTNSGAGEMPAWADAALDVLPTVPSAQRTRVVRRPQLLTSDEIDRLEQAAKTLLPSCGRAVRNVKDELQPSAIMEGPWETTYLHTKGECHNDPKLAAVLHRLLTVAQQVDEEEGWNLLKPRKEAGPIHWRTVEYHVVKPGGSLSDPAHFDPGSLVTVDVMLAHTEDFEGGAFSTPEALGRCDESTPSGMAEEFKVHTFERGDAVFFMSHKRHTVAPVSAGCRRVLIAELWHGPQRHCAHRCMNRVGGCAFDLAEARR